MVTNAKKGKPTTDVSDPQKKSARLKKVKAQNDAEKPVTPALKKAKGKLNKPEGSVLKTPLKQQKPAKGKPTEEKIQKKKGPVAENSVTEPKKTLKKKPQAKSEKKGDESGTSKFSKSVKARMSKKSRILKLKEKAEQGDEETFNKIQEVIKKMQSSAHTKHSKRKLGQYKNILSKFSKDGGSTPKKTPKKAKQSK